MVILGWIIWIIFAYFASQVIATGLWQFFALPSSENTVVLVIMQFLVYGLMLAITLLGPWVLRKKIRLAKFRELLAINLPIKLHDIFSGIRGVLIYYALLIAVMVPLMVLFPDVINQEQSIGFTPAGNTWWELVLIFLAVVILAPVVEELMMRGVLFGRIRTMLSFWPTALLVSIIFAIAHWQINVAIDTFILSMVACYTREKTGSIYAGIIIHTIKNCLAFVLLFII